MISVWLMGGLMSGQSAWAHAGLVRSVPAANALLPQTPSEVRLWFSEAVEPNFSKIILKTTDGIQVALPPTQIEATDRTQLFVKTGLLPDGVYTVLWRAVSAADGHSTDGNYVFAVGSGQSKLSGSVASQEAVPADGVLIRWLNLLSLGALAGSVAFVILVWNRTQFPSTPKLERRLRRAIIAAWAMVGATSVLLLLLQTAIAANISLSDAITSPLLGSVLGNTRFGTLWLERAILWGIFGFLIFWRRRIDALLLVICGGLLLTVSLFSHASGAGDSLVAVANDWLHLAMMSIWVGGLMQLLNIVGPLRRQTPSSKPNRANPSENAARQVGALVAHFSNTARLTVLVLLLTGIYAAWLNVGSIDGLFSTVYGKALIAKLIVFVPLLGLAAVNLLITERRLRAAQVIWIARLRVLTAAEIALLAGVLMAVGAMTSVSPTRSTIAQQNTAAQRAEIQVVNTFLEEQMVENDLHVRLKITPGLAGTNTFTVTLWSMLSGSYVTDANRVFLRFKSKTDDLARTEIDMLSQGNGVFSVAAPNLSLAGTWQVRVTVKRPDKFDALVDFEPKIIAVSALPSAASVTILPLLPARMPLLLLMGMVVLALSAAFFTDKRRRKPALGLLAASLICLIFIGLGIVQSVQLWREAAEPIVISDAYIYATALNAANATMDSTNLSSAAYMRIRNQGAQDDEFIAVSAEIAGSATLHQTQVSADVAQMRSADAFRIPAYGSLELTPGANHIMLTDLKTQIFPGQEVTLQLRFKSGRVLNVTAQAVAPGTQPAR